MGVNCDVHICVRSDAPLSAAARAQVIEICAAHELLCGPCRIGVPDAPALVDVWHRVRRVFRPKVQSRFERAGLNPYGGVTGGGGVRVVAEEEAGAWIAARVASLDTFMVGCGGPKWKGESVDGGFIFLASAAPVHVRTGNAYRDPKDRSPFVAPDGSVGVFHDVLSLSSKRNLDGKIAASSAFVRQLKKDLDLKVTCRASWW